MMILSSGTLLQCSNFHNMPPGSSHFKTFLCDAQNILRRSKMP